MHGTFQTYIKQSMPLKACIGLQPYVHYTVWLFAVLTLLIPFTSPPAWFDALGLRRSVYGLTLLPTGACCLVVHEAAHFAVFRLLGRGSTQRVILFPFGGVPVDGLDSLTPIDRFTVLLAGPLVNLGLGSLFALFGSPSVFRDLAVLNLGLGFLSLVPLWPLDGARVLREILVLRAVQPQQLSQTVLECSRVCAICLAIISIGCGNISLLFLTITLWIICHLDFFPGLDLAKLPAMSWDWIKTFGKRFQIQRFRASMLLWLGLSIQALTVCSAEPQVQSSFDLSAPHADAVVASGMAETNEEPWLQRSNPMRPGTLFETNVHCLAQHAGTELEVVETDVAKPRRGTFAQQSSFEGFVEGQTVSQEEFLRPASRNEASLIKLKHRLDLLTKGFSDIVCEMEANTLKTTTEMLSLLQLISALLLVLVSVVLVREFPQYRLSRRLQGLGQTPRRAELRVNSGIRENLTDAKAEQPSLSQTALTNSHKQAMLCFAGNRSPCQLPRSPGSERTHRPTQPVISVLEPAELLDRLSIAAKRFSRHPLKIEFTTENSWGMGLATHKGNVRSENQDFGLCFGIFGYQVALVADGLGGLKFGKHASYVAVRSAAWSIVKELSQSNLWCWRPPDVGKIAERALQAAAQRLGREGARIGLSEANDGLRTTLIVIIGSAREFGFAYSGDGGGLIVRSAGSVEKFLQPQKSDTQGCNVLAGSLGPITHGTPVTGTIPRRHGDLLMIGSDGVFDRVEESFPKDIIRGCIQFKGNLQEVAKKVLQELAELKDQLGYVCDDNMVLCLVGDKHHPNLAPDFWSQQPNAENATTSIQSGNSRNAESDDTQKKEPHENPHR